LTAPRRAFSVEKLLIFGARGLACALRDVGATTAIKEPAMRAYHRTVRTFLTLAFVSGIAACGAATPLGEQPTLSGQIEGWNKGAGYMLKATADDGDEVTLGAAPIDEAGNFSITLAGEETLSGHLIPMMLNSTMNGSTPTCSGNINLSPSSFSSATAQFNAVNGNTQIEIAHQLSGAIVGPRDTASYIYVDTDVDETGSVDCKNGSSQATASYNVHLKKGWNRLIQIYHSDGVTLDVNFHTGDLPDGMTWRHDG
jgi:hypothetical protein